MQNIMNPGMGNIAMAALPMIQGDFSPESIGQGAGSYLGGAAGGAAAGALSGTAAGAAMGSVLPGIGTVIGAGLGSVAGGEIGGLFGDSKAEKEEKKQKKKAQYQWLGDAISRFSGEISMRGQERRSAIDSINQYISGGNAQRAQMRPY
jgi:phage tail tape-measure protein